MRFPIKLPAFALVVFSERLLAKPIKESDDHCLPRLRTSLRFVFILPVALQLHMKLVRSKGENIKAYCASMTGKLMNLPRTD
jgi:hypothetical protein